MALIWISCGPVYWRIYVLLGLHRHSHIHRHRHRKHYRHHHRRVNNCYSDIDSLNMECWFVKPPVPYTQCSLQAFVGVCILFLHLHWGNDIIASDHEVYVKNGWCLPTTKPNKTRTLSIIRAIYCISRKSDSQVELKFLRRDKYHL